MESKEILRKVMQKELSKKRYRWLICKCPNTLKVQNLKSRKRKTSRRRPPRLKQNE